MLKKFFETIFLPNPKTFGKVMDDLPKLTPVDLNIPVSLSVDRFSGTADARVQFPLPDGRQGMTPQLGLSYGSPHSNGIFGRGWSMLGLPVIGVEGDGGLASYDATSGFSSSLGGRLVPARELDGTPQVHDEAGFRVHQYRAERDDGRIRFEKWIAQGTGRVHWRTRDTTNTVTIYGRAADGSSRIAHPIETSRVFQWLPEVQISATGNAIWFTYLAEDQRGNAGRRPSEVGRRDLLAQRYLKRISWVNLAPADPARAGDFDPTTSDWAYHVVFDYGDHSADPPQIDPDRDWVARSDAFSVGTPGFELRTWRLCQRIIVFHQFAELGPVPVPVTSFEMTYDAAPQGAQLTGLQRVGYRTSGAGTTTARVPMTQFQYSQPAVSQSFQRLPRPIEVAAPSGFYTNRTRLIDLYGNGLPGILSDGQSGWFFQENLGGGHFAAPRLVNARPAHSLAAVALGDIDGNGNVDAVTYSSGGAGRYAFDRETQTWSAFRPFDHMPKVSGLGKVERLDLTGDGLSDLVVKDRQSVVYYKGRGKAGFESAARRVQLAHSQDTGMPGLPPIATDAMSDFMFADMTGDGLRDQVMIRPGLVAYWPNLGHGVFGRPVLMENAPALGGRAKFGIDRVLLADLDGTGTADIIFIGEGEIEIWQNASGNGFVQGDVISGLPFIDTKSLIEITDIMGTGQQSLIWTASTANGAPTMQMLHLSAAVSPGLLQSVDNAMGRVEQITYGHSLTHYLRDRNTARAWDTALPFHSIVVDAIRTEDQIGGTETRAVFQYRQGAFDSVLRRFAGFGEVDMIDADHIHEDDDEFATSTPSLTRSFFDQGAVADPRGRFWAGDPDAVVVAPFQIDMGSSVGIDGDTYTELRAAIMGRDIRTEIYALGPDGPEVNPLSITAAGYTVRIEQPARGAPDSRGRRRADKRAVTSVFETENANLLYDGQPNDPRVTHGFVLDQDAFGAATLVAEVIYPRRAVIASVDAQQTRLHCSLRRARMAHVSDADILALNQPIEEETFVVPDLAAPARGYFTSAEIAGVALVALAGPLHHDQTPVAGRAIRVDWSRLFYWNAAGTDALPLGQSAQPLRMHHSQTAVASADFMADLHGVGIEARRDALGYILQDGHWWQGSEPLLYADGAGFFLGTGTVLRDGRHVSTSYDISALFALTTTDANGAVATRDMDYTALQPARTQTPNGGWQAFEFDALGIPVRSAFGGTVSDGAGGTHPYGFDVLAASAGTDIATIIADPGSALGGAAMVMAYDLDAWSRDATPIAMAQVATTDLTHDGLGGRQTTGIRPTTMAYYDGLGREVMSKLRAEPGPAIQRDAGGAIVVGGDGAPVLAPVAERWATTGWINYNAKGMAVRSFEGFFSTTHGYEDDAVLQGLGHGTRQFYDAAGRLSQRLLPDGAAEHFSYSPWWHRSYDANDNVASSAWRLSREILPVSHPDRHALDVTLDHGDTPIEVSFDGAGRTILAQEDDGLGNIRSVRSVFGWAGNPLEVTDARAITSMRLTQDMVGRVMREVSADAGTTVQLFDAADNPVSSQLANGHVTTTQFDVMDRVQFVSVDDGTGPRQIETFVYADDPNDGANQRANLYGQPVEVHDEAGRYRLIAASPSGTALHRETQFFDDPDVQIDLLAAPALSPEVFTDQMALNALDRVSREVRSDGSVIVPRFGQRGDMTAMSVSTLDGTVAPFDVIADIANSLEDQRETARLGNGVTISRQYDPMTRRVTQITARRPAAPGRAALLQDLHYTYDPVGNITTCRDLAHGTGAGGSSAFFNGAAAVSADRRYRYDGFYRLVGCEGRAHPGLTRHHGRPTSMPLSDGSLLERFTQTYSYDVSGNMTRLRHSGGVSNWTQDFWVDAASNLARPVNGADGLPVANPAADFGSGGERIRMDHLSQMAWRHDQRLSRVVIVDRSADGRPDDDEVYVYDAGGARTRKITRRLLADGSLDRREVLYLGGCEIHRHFRGATLTLERRTTRLSDGLGEVAEMHRWTQDTTNRETDQPGQHVVRYMLSDHLGSATLRLNETAQIMSYEEYMPFGSVAFAASDSAREVSLKTAGFISKECDALTGLHYIGQRYYASWLCRWISPDPAGDVDGPNLFLYAKNNPVVNSDPTGLQSTTTRERGREVPVRAATPSAVTARFHSLPAAEQARLRGLMAERNFAWFMSRVGEVHFGTKAQINVISERLLAEGHDVGTLQNNGAQTTDNADEATQGAGGSTVETTEEDATDETGTITPEASADATVEREDDDGEDDETVVGDPDGKGDKGTEESDENGPGRAVGSDKNGTGGGGTSEDPNARGRGDHGTGLGGGCGDPTASGLGNRDTTGTGQGNGTLPGGVPGGEVGGSGTTAGANGTGDTPGGRDGSTGTGDTPGGGGPGGGEGGIEGGSTNGGETGGAAPDGSNPQSGTGGGTEPAPAGTVPPQRDGGSPGGTPDGSNDGGGSGSPQPAQGQEGTGGSGGQTPATAMDHIVRVAGYWNLEFSDSPKGESGGIPGGMGSLNLGAWGQAAYLALTVVDVALTIASFGGLAGIKAGLKVALKAVTSLGRRALTRIGTVFTRKFWQRAGQGAMRAGINWNPFRSRSLREFWDRSSSYVTSSFVQLPGQLKAVGSRVEFLGFRSPGGSRIWASTDVVDVGHVKDIVTHLDGNGGKGVINVLTGRHGDPSGLDFMTRDFKFFVEDLIALPKSARIDIHDVTRMTDAQLAGILQHSDEVVLAWCHSEHSRRIIRALGLNFKSIAPF